MTTKEQYREAAKEWMAAQKAVNDMVYGSDAPLDLKTYGAAVDHLDKTGARAIELARQMLAEASERARRKG